MTAVDREILRHVNPFLDECPVCIENPRTTALFILYGNLDWVRRRYVLSLSLSLMLKNPDGERSYFILTCPFSVIVRFSLVISIFQPIFLAVGSPPQQPVGEWWAGSPVTGRWPIKLFAVIETTQTGCSSTSWPLFRLFSSKDFKYFGALKAPSHVFCGSFPLLSAWQLH